MSVRSSRSVGNGSGNGAKVVAKKPFCKVCFDTGKSADVYGSHFVRESPDVNSRVVCPTLLALVCCYCGIQGHTVSKCKKITQAPKKNVMLCSPVQPAVMKSVQKKLANVFQNLSDDSDDEDRDMETASVTMDDSDDDHGDDYRTPEKPRASYANAVICGAPIKERKDSAFDCSLSISTVSSVCTPVAEKTYLPARLRYFSRSWADASDSDEE